jgi:hypothetical protein
MSHFIKAIFILCLTTTHLLAAEKDPTQEATIPEPWFQIHSCAYFFKIKPPKAFKVARLDSFQDMSKFRTSDLFYTINAKPEVVWEQYQTINPLVIWSNARCRIVAVYVPSTDKTLDRDTLKTEWRGFEKGMKIFVDMSSLPLAITNRPAMGVGLEITRLDPAAKVVVFRYLEGTPSYGEQVIQFRASEKNPGATDIIHKTWFRSYGKLIELMYPLYHRLMINGMHKRFKWEIESGAH